MKFAFVCILLRFKKKLNRLYHIYTELVTHKTYTTYTPKLAKLTTQDNLVIIVETHTCQLLVTNLASNITATITTMLAMSLWMAA